LALLAALSIGVVMLVGGFVFGLCGSMEYTTACNGLFAGDPDGPCWAILVLICLIGLVYSFVRRPTTKGGTMNLITLRDRTEQETKSSEEEPSGRPIDNRLSVPVSCRPVANHRLVWLFWMWGAEPLHHSHFVHRQ